MKRLTGTQNQSDKWPMNLINERWNIKEGENGWKKGCCEIEIQIKK